MFSTDPIADMLTRIRNAIMAGQTSVNVPFSSIKLSVTEALIKIGFIDSYKTEEVAGFKRISIVINQPGTNPRISHIRKISKPGRRMYSKVDDIPKSLGGRGVILVSTSKGLMTDSEARKARIGGELVCEVY